jgi:hypothetical protein
VIAKAITAYHQHDWGQTRIEMTWWSKNQDTPTSGECEGTEVLAEPKGFEENRWHGDCEGNHHVPSTPLELTHIQIWSEIKMNPCQESVEAQRCWQSPRVLRKTDGTTIAKAIAVYLQHDWGQTHRDDVMFIEQTHTDVR